MASAYGKKWGTCHAYQGREYVMTVQDEGPVMFGGENVEVYTNTLLSKNKYMNK